MTATSYVVLDNDDLGANKIFRAATASALDTNPVSIAQRGTGAPWLNGVGALEIITTGSGNWTVPAGVYRIKATAVGGGGGGYNGGSLAYNGGDTTFGALTGSGGKGGSTSSGVGGSASGGTLNITGGSGGQIDPCGGGSTQGFGGVARPGTSESGAGYGGGGGGGTSGSGNGGGGGGTAIKVISVEPGDLIAYSVGGSGSAGSASGAGAHGIIIIEY